jgi:hypothetical protein
VTTFGNRLPTGPGSRGGHYHEPEFRRIYHSAWRASHPEYREREALRRANARSSARGDVAPSRLAPGTLPEPTVSCVCNCGCGEAVVVFCGFCREGQHNESETFAS